MKKKIALVLSGGGARGTAHIGAIEELLDQGYEISSIAGTSMGAIVGGMYALGRMDEFKDWICSLDKLKVFQLVDFSLGQRGLVKAEKVFKAMQEFAQDKSIEDLNIPYAAVAADIINKEEVIFNSGSLYEAMRASMAIPSVVTPVKTDNGLLVDGGVMNNIPVNHVKRTKGDKLVVVNVNADVPHKPVKQSKEEESQSKSKYQEKIKEFYNHLQKLYPFHKEEKFGYLDLAVKSVNLMIYQIGQLHLEKYSPDILINISRDSCGTYDFYRAEEMTLLGRQVTKNALDL